ncbi:hypothetical protein [uncultured Corynebacterium sp.]|uniref:hypothetical protein n=1 Tax=uncultured Corynebacterium sp. TaxID=159447 RepID=UPI0028EB18CA|nr:hypothetical protein [uncultured Corynebacterium sp.]
MTLTACAFPVGSNMNAQIATPTLPTDYPTEFPTDYPTELPTELSTSIAATPTTTSAEPKPVEIPLTNITFDDPETQDHIEVLSIIRNFPSDARGTGREIVLLQVKVIPGEVYTNIISRGDFRLSSKDDKRGSSPTSYPEEAMEKAGYTPIGDVKSGDGERVGWYGVIAGRNVDSYTLTYTRQAAEILMPSASDKKEIPKFEKSFELPAAPTSK